ncbi:hypothetical protein ACP179_02085 (plasmid) [Xenorhabdus stockiae]|uniref:hypothetical protein n=1 Tax=Xenorhabdus stockiae TaxID=351614 RepID=UPI003CE959EE
MIKTELRPCESAEPGYASLHIEGWQGMIESVMVSIQRNQDRCFLSVEGQWINNEEWIRLPELQEKGDDLETRIGPVLVDALLAERQVAYRVTAVDAAGFREFGGLKIVDGVLSSLAKGEYAATSNINEYVPQSPEPAVLAQVETPIIETEPLAEQFASPNLQESSKPLVIQPDEPAKTPSPLPAKKSNKLPLIALILLLIAIIVGMCWWLLKPETKSEPATVSASENTPCATENMVKGSGLDFVKSCLWSQPSSKQVLEVIQQAKETKQCDVAQRLYAYKSQSGDVQIALRYAQEYDPETATKGGCFVADAQTAIYWYEVLINQDPQNKEARARLAILKK